MTILSGQTIRMRRIMTPHCERTRCPRTGMTYGLSVAGYDVRVAERLVLYPPDMADPRLKHHSFVLASTMEYFNMHTDLLARVHDKSTLARRGLSVFNTVIEPGWRGYLTLELSNKGTEVIRMEPGDPVAQVVFELLDEPAERPYEGRYQDQEAGPQAARYLEEGDRV